MAHEILSIKLCELDEQIHRMHSRIYLSESAKHSQVANEITLLQKECAETELMLQRELKFSRASTVSRLSETYTKVERIIQEARDEINGQIQEEGEMSSVEEKILFAEYALDFAMQAANRALLASLEAIDAQMTLQEKEERRLS